MMKRKFPYLFFSILCFNPAFSQQETATADSSLRVTAPVTSPVPQTITQASVATAFLFKPWIGLGAGLFTFYGDVNNKKLATPQQSRIAYELSISKDLNSFLNLKFYTLFGKMGANERNSAGRNLNFETDVRMGGVSISYNCNIALPKKRSIEPYLSLGFESFEFLSKTDMYDKNGNKYYYWSDGSIKNLAETDPNAANAISIIRDYKYESDVRELNADGFGKYPERSWALPVGAGITFLLNERVRFKIGTAMHYAFTDLVDGVSYNSIGNRQGDLKNDKFLLTSFSLHYDLTSTKDKMSPEDRLKYMSVDWYALDMEDRDGDGVKDPEDSCQGTPAGVPVDLKGCPLDGDKDGVPDFADKQLDSPLNSIVDKNGAEQIDSLVTKKWLAYSDSTYLEKNTVVNPVASWLVRKPKAGAKTFTVRIAAYASSVPADTMGKLLTIPDISSGTLPDSSTIYTVGSFYKIAEAEKRKKELQEQGFSDATIVYYDGDKYVEAGDTVVAPITTVTSTRTNNNTTSNNNSTVNSSNNNSKPSTTSALNIPAVNDDGTVIRVQLGAYKKPLSKNIFNEVPNLVLVKTENGLYKYLSGSFKTVDQAAKHRAMLVERGYNGAFVVAYKDGKKVPLPALNNSTTNFESAFDPKDPTDPTKISFTVQVGVFKNTPPVDIQEKFNTEKSISSEITEANLTRYISGSFVDYDAVQRHKEELVKKGFEDSFIISYYNGKIIPLQEALLILQAH